LMYVTYPTLKRLFLKLDVTPITGLIAIGATIGSIALLAASAQFIAEQQRIYDLTLNQPPEHINTILPTTESIERGQSLYDVYCVMWQDEADDYQNLISQLDAISDDFLYDVTVNGWRDLPACEDDLTDSQRWDIINYFRTFEVREF